MPLSSSEYCSIRLSITAKCLAQWLSDRSSRVLGSLARTATEWRRRCHEQVLRHEAAAPPCRLTHTYLTGYTSINSQQVIDPKCRTITMCSSERSPIRLGGLSSSDCASKESRRSGH